MNAPTIFYNTEISSKQSFQILGTEYMYIISSGLYIGSNLLSLSGRIVCEIVMLYQHRALYILIIYLIQEEPMQGYFSTGLPLSTTYMVVGYV